MNTSRALEVLERLAPARAVELEARLDAAAELADRSGEWGAYDEAVAELVVEAERELERE